VEYNIKYMNCGTCSGTVATELVLLRTGETKSRE
jgi:hypothetical protein